jgi:hypothetical protein
MPLVPVIQLTDIVSPDLNSHQGFAADSAYYYTIGTRSLKRWSRGNRWILLAHNKKAFRGTPGHLNHIGDGDVHDGKLIVPAINNHGRKKETTLRVFLIYDAETLQLIRTVDVSKVTSAERLRGSLTIVPEHGANGILYEASYQNPNSINLFDLETFELLGEMKLSRPIPHIQGITWKYPYFFIATNEGDLYTSDRDGNVSKVFHFPDCIFQCEGIDYADNGLWWLVDTGDDENVHYLSLRYEWLGKGEPSRKSGPQKP